MPFIDDIFDIHGIRRRARAVQEEARRERADALREREVVAKEQIAAANARQRT